MADVQYDGRDLEAMSFAVRYHRWILSLFTPYLRGRVAEVGAGIGSFSELLLEMPIDSLVALEPSRSMYAVLSERAAADPRLTARNNFFSEVATATAFDTIVYVNVLEHIADDTTELITAFEALAPGGHLCIFVPALPALMSVHDRLIGHYRRYLRRELVEKMQRAGFEVMRAHYFDVVGILPWYVLCTLLGRSPRGGAVGLYDSVVVPVMRVVESLMRPPIGKNLVIVGRKPNVRTPGSSRLQ